MGHEFIAERMSAALQPGSLKLLSGSKMGRAEYLIAMGWTGIHHKTAHTLYHLAMTFDPSLYPESLAIVERRVRNMAARRNWDEKPHKLRDLAQMALNFILFPACPKCHGRKFEEIPGTNRLSDHYCTSCVGTGLRRVGSKRIAEIAHDIGDFEAVMIGGVVKRVIGD